MNKFRITGWCLVLLGIAILGRKTYLIAVVAPQQAERGLVDTAIIFAGSILIGVGLVVRKLKAPAK